MSQRAVEVDPTFFLRIRVHAPLSVRQVATLRKVGPGLSEHSPALLLEEWRRIQEITLGPFGRKYQAERARSELSGVGLAAEIMST